MNEDNENNERFRLEIIDITDQMIVDIITEILLAGYSVCPEDRVWVHGDTLSYVTVSSVTTLGSVMLFNQLN